MTAAASGRLTALTEPIDHADPRARGGPRDWPRLLYLAYSRVAAPDAYDWGCLNALLDQRVDIFDVIEYGDPERLLGEAPAARSARLQTSRGPLTPLEVAVQLNRDARATLLV